MEKKVTVVLSLLSAAFLLVVLATTLRVTTAFATPLVAITDAAVAIKNGDILRRVPVNSGDEIGSLAKSINEMAEKLSSDIDQLRRLERVRREFLGNVSHELRTPIFAIQGYLETLLDGAVDDRAVNREFVTKAVRHAARLDALLSDLIEISRIESGEMKLSFRYFSPGELLAQVVEDMQPIAARKHVSLGYDAQCPDTVTVFGDKERIKQVLVNLIDNGIKYTDAGGNVRCTVFPSGERFEIAVEDTGSGIPAEHQSRIFERFYRVDRDRSREAGGTGLGLAIVKHIVEAHESTVQVTSEVGRGSRFSFHLKQ